jgi:1-aminocyclopropane-1-carboxylate deaminase
MSGIYSKLSGANIQALSLQKHTMIDLQFHSPIEQIKHPFYQQKQVNVFIKRDDLIHPFISGNKWRKLKYLLHQALAKQQQHLVTFGGAYSNHLLATACAAAKFGFKSTGFVRGEPVQNDTLMLCKLFGMELIFVNRGNYNNKQKLFQDHFAHDRQAFFIDEGGASIEATDGCAELIDELGIAYDHIFCACGTGTTLAGIIKGLEKKTLHTQVHGVPVFKNGNFIRKEVLKYFDYTPAFDLHLDYHFGGYAKSKPELIKFIQTFASTTGILLDPIYTGKLGYAIHDLIQQDHFSPESSILMIHTGGLFGLLGMSNKFYS